MHIYLILATILAHRLVAAFTPARAVTPFLPTLGKVYVVGESTVANDSEVQDVVEAGDKKSELQFRADINTASNALSYSSREEVEAFFTCPNNRHLFITAGGVREYEKLEMKAEILADWARKCELEGNAIPNDSDEVFAVKTGGMSFPGLSLETRATMGIKLVERESGPTYEITLIGDDRKVKGLPPVVYIFNRLTGGGGSDSGSSHNLSSTKIMCDFNAEDSNVMFRISTQFLINVRFPSVLMKILPTTKEKAEEQGSLAITKVVSSDIEKSMAAFEVAYRRKIT
jgi:hypothetical protein